MKSDIRLYTNILSLLFDVMSSPLVLARPDFGNVRTFFQVMRTYVALHGRARALIARTITRMTPGVVVDLRRISIPL